VWKNNTCTLQSVCVVKPDDVTHQWRGCDGIDNLSSNNVFPSINLQFVIAVVMEDKTVVLLLGCVSRAKRISWLHRYNGTNGELLKSVTTVRNDAQVRMNVVSFRFLC
jgi:hypothetical protein